MKKQITLLAAGAMLALAACNGADHGAGTMTQAQQDSAVNARAAEQQARMQRNNDSLVNVEAQRKADSIMNATKMVQKDGHAAGKAGVKTVKKTEVITKSVSTGGFGTQSDANTSKDKKAVEGGGFGTQSDKKQSQNKKEVQGGGFGTQADHK